MPYVVENKEPTHGLANQLGAYPPYTEATISVRTVFVSAG